MIPPPYLVGPDIPPPVGVPPPTAPPWPILTLRRLMWRLLRIKAMTVAILGVVVAGLRAVIFVMPLLGLPSVATWVDHGASMNLSTNTGPNASLVAILLLCTLPILPLLLVILVVAVGRR